MRKAALWLLLFLASFAAFTPASSLTAGSSLNLTTTHYASLATAEAACAVCTKNIINITEPYGTVADQAAGAAVYYPYQVSSTLTVYNVLVTKGLALLNVTLGGNSYSSSYGQTVIQSGAAGSAFSINGLALKAALPIGNKGQFGYTVMLIKTAPLNMQAIRNGKRVEDIISPQIWNGTPISVLQSGTLNASSISQAINSISVPAGDSAQVIFTMQSDANYTFEDPNVIFTTNQVWTVPSNIVGNVMVQVVGAGGAGGGAGAVSAGGGGSSAFWNAVIAPGGGGGGTDSGVNGGGGGCISGAGGKGDNGDGPGNPGAGGGGGCYAEANIVSSTLPATVNIIIGQGGQVSYDGTAANALGYFNGGGGEIYTSGYGSGGGGGSTGAGHLPSGNTGGPGGTGNWVGQVGISGSTGALGINSGTGNGGLPGATLSGTTCGVGSSTGSPTTGNIPGCGGGAELSASYAVPGAPGSNGIVIISYTTSSPSSPLTLNSITISNTTIDATQWQVITAYVYNGVPSYTYNIMVFNSVKKVANQLVTGVSLTYNSFAFVQQAAWGTGVFTVNVIVNDSNSPTTYVYNTPATTYNANTQLLSTSWKASNSMLDYDQYQTLNAILSGGFSTYTYNILVYNAIDALVYNSLSTGSALTSNMVTFQINPSWLTGVYTANVYIWDSASTNMKVSNTLTFVVNTLLNANPPIPTTATIDNGQGLTLTSQPIGGDPPYIAYQWYSGSSPSCLSDTTPLGTSSTQAISPTSNTYYCYSATDSALATALSSDPANIIVNPALLATWIVGSNPINTGGIQTLTANTLGTGTSQWVFNIVVYNSIDALVYNSLSPYQSQTFNIVSYIQNAAWGVGNFIANVIVTDSAYNPTTITNTLTYVVSTTTTTTTSTSTSTIITTTIIAGAITCARPIFNLSVVSGNTYINDDPVNTMTLYVQANSINGNVSVDLNQTVVGKILSGQLGGGFVLPMTWTTNLIFANSPSVMVQCSQGGGTTILVNQDSYQYLVVGLGVGVTMGIVYQTKRNKKGRKKKGLDG